IDRLSDRWDSRWTARRPFGWRLTPPKLFDIALCPRQGKSDDRLAVRRWLPVCPPGNVGDLKIAHDGTRRQPPADLGYPRRVAGLERANRLILVGLVLRTQEPGPIAPIGALEWSVTDPALHHHPRR